MSTATMPTGQRVYTGHRLVLDRATWSDYVRFSDLLDERHVRVTFDGARMEIMTVSPGHERAKKLLDRLLSVLIEELNIAIVSFGSMTCRREDLERGLEPDECYWIENAPKVRGRTNIDLERDPPPDLALEVEVSRSALDRMELYGSLRVPEVWRWDGQSLRVCLLRSDNTYADGKQSLAFPFLPIAAVERFLREGEQMEDAEFLRAFRKWVREQVANEWKPAAGKKGKKKRR